LQAQLEAEGIALPSNDQNPRHLVRALETGGVPANKQALLPWTLVIGISLDRLDLKKRLAKRTDKMIRAGLEHEVKELAARYGWETEAMSAVGYREWQAFFAGQQTRPQTQELITKNSLAYAKKQRTWFKRNKSIHWVTDPSKAVDITTTLLNKLQ